jgi:hypothetical protein
LAIVTVTHARFFLMCAHTTAHVTAWSASQEPRIIPVSPVASAT